MVVGHSAFLCLKAARINYLAYPYPDATMLSEQLSSYITCRFRLQLDRSRMILNPIVASLFAMPKLPPCSLVLTPSYSFVLHRLLSLSNFTLALLANAEIIRQFSQNPTPHYSLSRNLTGSTTSCS